MSKTTGYTCDVCKKFTVADSTPTGWFHVSVILPKSQEVPTSELSNALDVCSNKCLRDLGKLRMEAAGEGRPTSQKARDNAPKTFTIQSHTRWHVSRDELNLECPFCLEMMEAS